MDVVADGERVDVLVLRRIGEQAVQLGRADQATAETDHHHTGGDRLRGEQAAAGDR